MTPTFLIIHTAAFDGDADIDEVRRWHLARGFKDVGYHWYIRRSGEIQQGRLENAIGAHCTHMGMNRKSLGLCCEGHGDHEKFLPVQMAAMIDLYAEIARRWRIPIVNVRGHGETGAPKTCPGILNDMDDIRNALSQWA